MSQSLAAMFKDMTPEQLAQHAAEEQRWADCLQRMAAQAQREADAARKELKRRKRA